MVERALSQRFVGSCRDYAILLCPMYRHIDIPVRVRCGFDRYFGIKKDFYDNHWIYEYWSGQNHWIIVDANVDDVVRSKQGITMDTLDSPSDFFITSARAWKLIRSGKVDPKKFGVLVLEDINGLWFIRGSILHDLNKSTLDGKG